MGRFTIVGVAAFLALGVSAAAAQQDGTATESGTTAQTDQLVSHQCVRFDPDNVSVAGDGQGYALVDGDQWIKDVNGSRAEARLAVYIIRFYGMDEFCRIGQTAGAPTYFLVNGDAPRGRSPSEDCIWFDQTGSQLTENHGQWSLVGRDGTSLSLGRNKAAALEAVSTIRNRNFSEICFVGRPHPSMVYFIQ